MLPIVATLNYNLAILTVLLQVATLFFAVDVFILKGRYTKRIVRSYGLIAAFLLALGASAMTLVYSDVFGFVPCSLCWFQRIFLYPQVVMLGIALYIGDTRVALYGVVLSLLGAIVALYQHVIQMGGSEFIACPESAGDCAQRIIFEFGYVTFPLMAFTLFVFLGVLYLAYMRATKDAA